MLIDKTEKRDVTLIKLTNLRRGQARKVNKHRSVSYLRVFKYLAKIVDETQTNNRFIFLMQVI